MKRLPCLSVSTLAFAGLVGLGAFSVVACNVTPAEDEVVTGDSALRNLTASEIVGSIGYGETKTISYTSEPRYRALSFQATKGDKIDARFTGAKGLDTVGFVLSDTFATLAQNDDESANTRSSRVGYEISKTGTYYLAVREANEEDGTITVSLAKAGGEVPVTPVDPPPSPAEVFNPASCGGSTMTQARAITYFPKGSAAGRVTISEKPGRAYLRARVCSEFSGCASWVEKDVTKPTSEGAFKSYVTEYFNTAPGVLEVALTDRANDPIDFFMTVSTGAGYRSRSNDHILATHRLELLQYVKPRSARPVGYSDRSHSGFDASETTQTWGTTYLHGFVTLPVAEANLNLVPLSGVDWDTTINETCAQARFSTVKVSSGKQQRVELQGVVHWDLRKP